MSRLCVAAALLAACASLSFPALASAAACPGNPTAIGTSRTIAVDPAEHRRIGSMQYKEVLPLAHKEVVLTFDDGPLPKYTGAILDALEAECVKATFFLVGNMARAYPDWVRKVYDAGHTVGTHSNSHPRAFRKLAYDTGVLEVEQGIATVSAALGEKRPLAPFFRFPGFGSTAEFERYLAARGLMTWGADVPGDDWKHISAATIVDRVVSRLERKGRGVVLLHDIHATTAAAVPMLLRELKARGFRIVHVVPSGAGRPKTVTEPEAWVLNRPRGTNWPMLLPSNLNEPPAFSVPSALSFGFPHPLADTLTIGSFDGERPAMALPRLALAMPASARLRMRWPHGGAAEASAGEEALPVPAMGELNEPSMFGGKSFTPAASSVMPGTPSAGDHAATEPKPRPARVANTPRKRAQAPMVLRPAPAAMVREPMPLGRDTNTGLAPRENRTPMAVHAEASAGTPPVWARMFNWIYTQQ